MKKTFFKSKHIYWLCIAFVIIISFLIWFFIFTSTGKICHAQIIVEIYRKSKEKYDPEEKAELLTKIGPEISPFLANNILLTKEIGIDVAVAQALFNMKSKLLSNKCAELLTHHNKEVRWSIVHFIKRKAREIPEQCEVFMATNVINSLKKMETSDPEPNLKLEATAILKYLHIKSDVQE